MVRPLETQPAIFLCEECGLGYDNEATARECEAYCRTHQSCSLQITAKAVYRPE